jgi:hypothetical protein
MEDIEDYDYNKRCGSCAKVIGDDLHTTFIDGEGNTENQELIAERVKNLTEEYDKLERLSTQDSKDYELFLIKKRIATLTTSMANLYVGGNTEMEKRTRKFLIEDAVYACRSAIDNGYIVGGNLIVPKIINKYENDIIQKLIKDPILEYIHNIYETELDVSLLYDNILGYIAASFLSSFSRVLSNANIDEEEANKIMLTCIEQDKIYNVKTRLYENDKDTLVINSSETDIEIMKASFSIIGLLATSNQFIAINTMN